MRGDLLEMRVVHTYSVLLGVSDLLLFFATEKFRVQSPAFVDALRQRHPSLRAGDCARFALPLQRVATLKGSRALLSPSTLDNCSPTISSDWSVWRLRTALGNCLGENHRAAHQCVFCSTGRCSASQRTTLTTVVLCACDGPSAEEKLT